MKYKSEVDVGVLCLFFNRPEYFRQVFEQVRKARPSKLFLYQDGPRDGRNDMPGILECRKIAENIDWDCDIHRNYLEKNQGCDPSEYLAQKWAFTFVDKCIILEDDDVPSVSFFRFCKEMLDKYEYDDRVAIISGMNYEEVSKYCPYDYFFSEDMAIWGWATWKRVVDNWEGDYGFMKDQYHMSLMAKYIKEAKLRNLIPMMKWHSKSGKEFYESILLAYMYLHHSLSIVPSKNLINNIGLTGGTHINTGLNGIPKGERPLYTMKRFELSFPLKHPKYIIDNLYYKDATDNLLARCQPIKAWYRLQEARIRRAIIKVKSLFNKLGGGISYCPISVTLQSVNLERRAA